MNLVKTVYFLLLAYFLIPASVTARNAVHREGLKSRSIYSTFALTANNIISKNAKLSESAISSTSLSGTSTLTVTALPLNVVKGTAVSTVIAAGSYTVTGLLNGDIASNVLTGTIGYSTNYTPTTLEGTPGLTITPTGLSSSNYTISYESAAINVSNSTLLATGVDKAILVQWQTNTNALGYIVEFKTSSTLNWNTAVNSNTLKNGYTITGLVNGLNYDIRITTKLANNTYSYATVSALPTSSPDMTMFYNHILSTGQSLSVGHSAVTLTTIQPFSNKTLNADQTALIPLIEPAFGADPTRESMSSALANSLTNYSGLGSNYKSIVTISGVSGARYSGIKKGTQSYNNALGQTSNALNLAINSSTPYKVNAVTVIHGESDQQDSRSAETYRSYLVEWQNDFNSDIKSITGQTNDTPLFTDQMASWTHYNFAVPSTAIGQWIAARDNLNKIILVTPKYMLDHGDVHLQNYSYRRLGEYYGKVMKKVLVDKQTWLPLSPKKLTISDNIIIAELNVPVSPIVVDNAAVLAKTNLGFEYFDNGQTATISDVSIISSNTLKITLSNIPTGDNKRLRYAYTGTPGSRAGGRLNPGAPRGNIRDSDATPAFYTDSSVPAAMGNLLRNWLISFDDPLVSASNQDIYVVATGNTSYNYSGLPEGPETVLTNSSGNVTYTYSGVGSTTYTPTSSKPTSIGTYQVVASVAANSIYNGASSSPLLFSIVEPIITITALDQSKEYGETLSTMGVIGKTYSVTGLLNGDVVSGVTLTYSGSPSGNLSTATVGKYSITPSELTLSSGELSKYKTITYVQGSLNVTPSTLTVTALPQTKAYGESLNVTGIVNKTFDVNGLKNGDVVSGVNLLFGGGNLSSASPGVYSIQGSGLTLSSGSVNNYTINYVQGNLNVTKATLTVTALPQSKAFGETLSVTAIVNKNFKIEGLKNNDVVSGVNLSYSGNPAGNLSTASIGTYSIQVSDLTLSSGNLTNYTISYIPGILKIVGIPIIVTSLPQKKVFGENSSTMGVLNSTFSVTGLRDGDIVSGVTLAYSGSPTGNLATALEGKYTVTPSGLTLSSGSLNNYVILYVPGVLSIVNPVENTSTTKGILLPRMTTTQRDNIVTPANSLLIYNTTNDRFEVFKNTCNCWVSVFDGGNKAAPN